MAKAASTTEGSLYVVDDQGQPGTVCPLKHTDVKADISGFLARVTVTQEFENPLAENIEAVYVFPLPQRSAVDDMTMMVGDRQVRGKIKPREEARRIFEQARAQGRLASLLDQERPNIFTQSVTNIGAGKKVKVVISYVETLQYEAGAYEFSFPMVVGPRYIPAHVRDAARIAPPVTRPGTRAGHDISIQVDLDAGVPVDTIECGTHEVDLQRRSSQRAVVQLRKKAVLPNKDFVLRYDVAGRKIADALLTHRGERGGFFTFLLQPPERIAPSEITPKEMVFVVDTSGSMSGFPIEKSKELMKLALDGLHERDTFNLITFSGDTHVLFPQPVAATPENVRKAQQFMLSRSGSGGTEMMKAIRTALQPSPKLALKLADDPGHVRVVCFLTDGYVGNDMEIIGEVKRYPNARVFSFGIGNSVNRFLLDKMAEEGRGEVEYVALNEDGSAAAKRLYERVRTPLLTDISIDWNGLPVTDVYPLRVPDLFSAKPLVLTGRYTGPAQGTLRLKGRMAGREIVRDIVVNLPGTQPERDVLATLWARTRVDHLMSQDWNGMQSGNPRAELQQEITRLGIKFRLMTQFTSFVAMEESTVMEGGRPRRIEVPVEMPHGVSYEGVFGEARQMAKMHMATGTTVSNLAAAPPMAQYSAREEKVKRPLSRDEGDASAARLDSRLRDARVVENGKVLVKIWLVSDSADLLKQLKQMGVEITAQRPGKLILARVAPEKLEELARMKEILFIGPDLGEPK
ncbi:MAG: VWA domain-containing protein [Acidobacteriia bacterium]|nr:VWA domain-containing protein [Terriglobia bacterium]